MTPSFIKRASQTDKSLSPLVGEGQKRRIRSTKVFAVAAVLLGAWTGLAAAAERPLTLAFIPQENPEKLIGDVRVITGYLERELGRKVKGFVTHG